MELRQLRAFAAVAEAGTYAGAAAALHLAQPAVWKQVRALEVELGLGLFERAGRGVALTPAGRSLLARCEALVGGADAFAATAADLRAGRVATLVIGCPPRLLPRALAGIVVAFRSAHPGIRVQLPEPVSADPLDDLHAGVLDLAVSHRPAVAGRGLRLYAVRTVALVPPGHPLSGRRTLDVRALSEQPLLLTPPGFRSRTRIEAAFDRAGVCARAELESPSPEVLATLAAAGAGIAVISDDALPDPIRAGAIPIADAIDGSPTDEVWLHARAPADPAVAAFLNAARAWARG